MTTRWIEDAWKKCMPLGLRDMCLMCLHYAGVQCWVWWDVGWVGWGEQLLQRFGSAFGGNSPAGSLGCQVCKVLRSGFWTFWLRHRSCFPNFLANWMEQLLHLLHFVEIQILTISGLDWKFKSLKSERCFESVIKIQAWNCTRYILDIIWYYDILWYHPFWILLEGCFFAHPAALPLHSQTTQGGDGCLSLGCDTSDLIGCASSGWWRYHGKLQRHLLIG